MTASGWLASGLRWALVIWGYALAWFLLTERVKLLACRFLDPVKAKPAPVGDGVLGDVARPGHGPAIDLRGEAAPTATVAPKATVAAQETVAPFHAASGPDGMYNDNSGCAYGQELKANGHSEPGKVGRRRCEWCAQHAA